MRRAVSTGARVLLDFALGIHIANGIRHGVPQNFEASERRAASPPADRSAEPIAPVLGPLSVTAVSSRVRCGVWCARGPGSSPT